MFRCICSLDKIVMKSDFLPGGLTPRKSSISTALRAKLAEKLKAAKVCGYKHCSNMILMKQLMCSNF